MENLPECLGTSQVCGILLDGRGGVEQWAQWTLDLLSRESVFAIESIYLMAVPDPSRRSPGGALFRWLNGWLNGSRGSAGSPLGRVELDIPQGVPVLALGTRIDENRARIAAADLDVLIWLESRALELDCDGLARLGVWKFCFGDPDEPLSQPPYWNEVAAGSPVSTLALERDAGRENLQRLALCHFATQPGLRVPRNSVEPLTLAGPVLLRNLLDVLDGQCLDHKASPVSVSATPAIRRMLPPPGNLATISLVARQALRSASVRLGSFGRKAGWFVATRSNPELFRTCQDRFVPQAFRQVPSAPGSQLADPFVVADNGRHWLFVEEVPAGAARGRLSVLELGGEGGVGKPVPILEKAYHLSYPCVFRDGPEFFMIPETSANNDIQLYRATRFPFEWKLERVLQANVRAVDTTPLLLDGIWYFFATSRPPRTGDFRFLVQQPRRRLALSSPKSGFAPMSGERGEPDHSFAVTAH